MFRPNGFRDNCNYHVFSRKGTGKHVTKLVVSFASCYPARVAHTGSPLSLDHRLAAATGAAYAIGALDAALRSSSVAAFWSERAAIVGLADCLALAGASLTPAEFFRSCVGLVEPVFFATLDRSLISAVVADCLPDLASGSVTAAAIERMMARSPLLVDDEWSAPRRSAMALRHAIDDAMAVTVADVGTAIVSMVRSVGAALAAARASSVAREDWHGWQIAARLPSLLRRIGLTSTPLPCLTGVTRAMRYATVASVDLEPMLWARLGDQARDGLTMLRRLEACARAWRERLDGLTTRSRAGQAAGLFLVWPACTRPQLAAALGVSGAGAGVVLAALTERDIVERTVFGGTSFYVAPESLGDFKLTPRQGRHPALPAGKLADAINDFDAAMATFDLLGLAVDPTGIDLPSPASAAVKRTDISP